MKKAYISFVLIISMLLSLVNVYADGISVTLNGGELSFDVPPQIISDRTFVPMRKIFEALGASVEWDDETKTVTGRKGDVVVNVSIGSAVLFKNGSPKMLDVAPTIIDSRTLVPIRAIAESFDCQVDWIEGSKTVKITADESINSTKTTLTAMQISEKVSPSVFYIEVYDSTNKAIASGSGFFISSDGVAVTNYHVIEDTNSAKITTINGKEYVVSNIISYDKNLDVAIIRVGKTATDGSSVYGFPSVTLADSDKIKAGQTVYAIGSPVGLKNTISNGIISNTSQVVDGDSFIQITAAISNGSSGGALVDEYGEALGITSAGIKDAENIGFAIPINVVKLFDLSSTGMSYEEFVKSNAKFILELDKNAVEIAVGESAVVSVYAEGKSNNWSIYWNIDQKSIAECKWGTWQNGGNICPLTITGLREGTAVVTVYSDVDFQGKTITVTVKKPQVQMYPSSSVNMPTYTSITGVGLSGSEIDENNNIYIYKYSYSSIDEVQRYVDYLTANGFTYHKKSENINTSQYYYISPENQTIRIVLAQIWRQVYVIVPR